MDKLSIPECQLVKEFQLEILGYDEEKKNVGKVFDILQKQGKIYYLEHLHLCETTNTFAGFTVFCAFLVILYTSSLKSL